MVPSDEIPKAILKIRIVEGFSGIEYPMIPAVISNGIKLEMETVIMRNDMNKANMIVKSI
jgi:hypothetical protein